ncbi:hypothetical protein [Paraburkholderia oxyphila]|uniref:hypothetical protein n=1 Tax=Paraburkholderia oxyphila TaxID=614212 RepID=UPI000486DCBD|nr:hypothetical protein [Paraburkholderia oxyphila]
MKCAVPDSAIGVIGISTVESGHAFVPFEPSWFNATEARFFKQAQRRQAQQEWLFSRFGMSGDGVDSEQMRRAAYRDAFNALAKVCRNAFDQVGRKLETQIRKQRSAFVYFDAWGETATFEGTNSWRDVISLDMLPKPILRDYGIRNFSCKVRGERNGFIHAIRLASDLLNSDEMDTVVVAGLFRSLPIMVLSSAAERVALHGAARSKLASPCPSVERAGCVVLRKHPAQGMSLAITSYSQLPESPQRARDELARTWAARCNDRTAYVMAGLHPSAAMRELERDAYAASAATAASAPGKRYLSVCDVYGDSGCMNPMLALTHLSNAADWRAGRHALISADDGRGGVWAMECWNVPHGAEELE